MRDAGLAVALLLLCALVNGSDESLAGTLGALWWVGTVAATLAVALRRRWPAVMLAVCCGAAIIHLTDSMPLTVIDLSVPILLYTVAVRYGWARSLGVLAVLLVLAVGSSSFAVLKARPAVGSGAEFRPDPDRPVSPVPTGSAVPAGPGREEQPAGPGGDAAEVPDGSNPGVGLPGGVGPGAGLPDGEGPDVGLPDRVGRGVGLPDGEGPGVGLPDGRNSGFGLPGGGIPGAGPMDAPPPGPQPGGFPGELAGESWVIAWNDLPGLVLTLIAAWALGAWTRSRRAHLAELRARAVDREREREQQAVLAVAAERGRISRELHDVVAHGLSVMVIQAQGGAAALDNRPDDTRAALEAIIKTGRASLADMRRVLATVGEVDDTWHPQPGLAMLPGLLDQVREAGTPVRLRVEGIPVESPSAVDLTAYRIVQEALTNTMKHAGPGAGAEVTVVHTGATLRIMVRDDGSGGGPGDGNGAGLRGMRERVRLLGGRCDAGPGVRGGFVVRAELPVTGRSEPAGSESLDVEPSVIEPLDDAEPFGAEPSGVEPLGVEPLGVEPLGVEPLGVEPLGVEASGVESSGESRS